MLEKLIDKAKNAMKEALVYAEKDYRWSHYVQKRQIYSMQTIIWLNSMPIWS